MHSSINGPFKGKHLNRNCDSEADLLVFPIIVLVYNTTMLEVLFQMPRDSNHPKGSTFVSLVNILWGGFGQQWFLPGNSPIDGIFAQSLSYR